MNRKILVTGSTGFVGRQVVRVLSECDLALRLIVRDDKEEQVKLLNNISEVVTTKDLFAEDANWWSLQCQNVDIVVHIAWYTEPGKYLNSSKNIDCLIGSLNLAKGVVKAGVKRFVGIGTCFEYDISGGLLSINTPLKPITPYADAKTALYLTLSHWLPKAGVDFAWCRLFYLYGEGEDTRRLVPYLRSKLEKGEYAELTTGVQIRDFLDIAVAGKMIAAVVKSKHKGPANICSGIPMSVRQLAEQIASEYGRCDLLKFGIRPDNPVDPICILGIPCLSLEAGIH